MTSRAFADLDAYERFLEDTFSTWSPEQRAAIAAATGERWLHVYEEFSEAESWGDPGSLRRALDAVWAAALGQRLSAGERTRLDRQLKESTPHMDDFDAPEALAASAIVGYALDCAAKTDNTGSAVWAVLSAFEAVSPDCLTYPEENPRFWKKAPVKKELAKQLTLVERVGAMTRLDEAAVTALRAALTTRALVGELPARRVAPKASGTSNQVLFEQYRGFMEPSLKGASWEPPLGSGVYMLAVSTLTPWSSRYSYRRTTMEGKLLRPDDVEAMRALVARNTALDAAEQGIPDWGSDVRWSIDQLYRNPYSNIEAPSPDAPHAYGPSMRRLWLEARRRGESDDGAWRAVSGWARHVPLAWAAEDRRKARGLAHGVPALGERLARPLVWEATGELDHPWLTSVDGVAWRVRLNDFPDDFMYSLLIDDDVAGDFHDWPGSWQRPGAG